VCSCRCQSSSSSSVLMRAYARPPRAAHLSHHLPQTHHPLHLQSYRRMVAVAADPPPQFFLVPFFSQLSLYKAFMLGGNDLLAISDLLGESRHEDIEEAGAVKARAFFSSGGTPVITPVFSKAPAAADPKAIWQDNEVSMCAFLGLMASTALCCCSVHPWVCTRRNRPTQITWCDSPRARASPPRCPPSTHWKRTYTIPGPSQSMTSCTSR
jgi:hypothetical protein